MMFARLEYPSSVKWRPGQRRWLWLATGILLIAAFARLIMLQEVPPGLAQDEVLDADIALFIRGGEHALFFSHGYGHEPLYHYWAVPFQALIGDNILSIKLPAVALGLLLIALTMRWAKRDYGTVVALISGLGLAISWWPIIFSRIGIRPIMEPVLLVVAIWFWPLRARQLTRPGIFKAALGGLFLGLSIYSYTAARIAPLIPIVLLVILGIQYFLIGRSKERRISEINTIRAQAVYAAVVALVAVVVYIPLALTLAANPELQQRIQQLEGPLVALRGGDFDPVVKAAIATLGVFSFTGDPRWTYTLPGRPLFDWVTAILFFCGLALALWRWRQPRYVVLVVWLLVGLLPSALSPDAPSTVRLIGALPVVYLMPGLAVGAADRWFSTRYPSSIKKWERARVFFLMVWLAILSVNLYRTVQDGFISWPANLETRLRYQTVLRDIGEHWQKNYPDKPIVVAEVFYEPIDGDSLRRVIGAEAIARWIQSGGGVSGAIIWPSLNEGYPGVLYVPEFAPLDPELVEVSGLSPEPVYRSGGIPSFAVYHLTEKAVPDFDPQPFNFVNEPGADPVISLDGLTFLDTPAAQLKLASWWEVAGTLPADLAIFIHLTNEDGDIIAQYDGLDAAAATLRRDDRFLQRHVIDVPENMEPGSYFLTLGLYRRGDGRRLPLSTGSDVVQFARCDLTVMHTPEFFCRLTKSGY